MLCIKIVSTVLIAILMLIFMIIWVSTSKQKEFMWVWFFIEVTYILSLFSIWG